jgi:hypothetical protein
MHHADIGLPGSSPTSQSIDTEARTLHLGGWQVSKEPGRLAGLSWDSDVAHQGFVTPYDLYETLPFRAA